MGFALLTLRRTVKFGFILALVIALAGWSIFLGWMLWYLIDFAFT
jgi:hypothetical protein